MKKLFSALLTALALAAVAPSAHAQEEKDAKPAPEIRLYHLDCGNITVTDLNVFSDTDAYIGKSKDLVASCYLIKHGEDWLLWDTGLPASTPRLADVTTRPFILSLQETIPEQLKKLDLKPEDIDYIGISHGHFDHTGQANAFPNAKLIIQKTEYDFMTSQTETAMNYHMPAEAIANYVGETAKEKRMLLSGDTDIFGDGTLKAISLPGHTPGHMALLVVLPKTGPVVLSGDQWHFEENRKWNGVPSFNYNRADTLASSDKLNKLIKNRRARIIIQHDPLDNAKLPALPEYLN